MDELFVDIRRQLFNCAYLDDVDKDARRQCVHQD